MTTSKHQKVNGEQPSIQQNISTSLSGRKKSLKRSGSQCHKNTGPETPSKMPSAINQEERKLHLSAKIKLLLFPLDERIRKGLEKDGHNPFLELTLRERKKISSVLEHLNNKWGNSSIAVGELMLFPYNAVVQNLTTCRSWTSSEIGITAAEVYAAIGSPDSFRLRYGWVSAQTNSSCQNMEILSSTNVQTEAKSRQVEPCYTNEVTDNAIERRVSTEQHQIVHMSQSEMRNEKLEPSKTCEPENDAAVKENSLASSIKSEESNMQNEMSFTSLLWSDLSNISVGGLLSESSLQGRFNNQDMKLNSCRSVPQPAAVISDSLDALIDQFRSPLASSDFSLNMPSSILDAENTCNSFSFSKLSSNKEILTLDHNAPTELSSQAVDARPFKSTLSEVKAQDGVSGSNAVHDFKTDPLSCPAGVFNNENSLGLSSIRWNDSLGPFDLPLTPRQVMKEDSISIGECVR